MSQNQFNTLNNYVNALRLKLFYLLSVKLSFPFWKKRLLMVRSDSIGDYIIFRNFIQELAHSAKFKGYELYLLTTTKMAPIVTELDSKLLKEVLTYDQSFSNSTNKSLILFNQLKSYRFSYVINPAYSPTSEMQYLIKYLPAKHKIGMSGDTSNQTLADKVTYEPCYSNLISTHPFDHEFVRQSAFFSELLAQKLTLNKPVLNGYSVTKTNQVLICPGAQHHYRIWPLPFFGRLITELAKHFPELSFIVVTGPDEEPLYEQIIANTKEQVKHYKISGITGLIKLMMGGSLVICNDSSAAHIAVACNTNSVCITNGNHFSRFIPYPPHMHVNQKVVFHPQLALQIKDGTAIQSYYGGSRLNIADVSVEMVYEACLHFLKQPQP